ncbi:hypothetical protein V5O48_009091 [Marasmius crinis-equi]|uniref:Uncharacterized protein n=1 Tax=Marasmius crinis-equi TaxID=585013 RepID=A0ABR3FCL7_9AGAR
MKFVSVATFAALVATAFAQRAEIGSPKAGAQVTAGSSFSVQVDRPNSLTGSQEMSIVIGFQSCASSPCHAPTDGIGRVLYSGAYNPQFSSPSDALPPHQNFDVTVPDSTPKGAAQLSLVHFSLVGASVVPLFETSTVDITVV